MEYVVIKEAILSLMNRLKTYQVRTPDGVIVPIYVRIWNNQIQNAVDSSGYLFQRPACFVEVVNDATYESIGEGFRSSNIAFRCHLCHDYFNNDGTMEQDLVIFDMRDDIIGLLALFCPAGCGPTVAVREEQEYDHKNLYHYVIDFVCNFTDGAANRWKKEGITLGDGPENIDIDATYNNG